VSSEGPVSDDESLVYMTGRGVNASSLTVGRRGGQCQPASLVVDEEHPPYQNLLNPCKTTSVLSRRVERKFVALLVCLDAIEVSARSDVQGRALCTATETNVGGKDRSRNAR
jgi:hypothetical protein